VSKAHNLLGSCGEETGVADRALTQMRSALVLFPVHHGLASEARSRMNSEPRTSNFPAHSRLKILA
jgi:hypothetical protein